MLPISVIVLTFNAESTIGATLASARAVSDDVHVVEGVATLRVMGCRGRCGFGAETATEPHHRILMGIETDLDVLLELFELAVTWPELEYAESPVIGPEAWMQFFERHRWSDPDRAERIFSLATDIAMIAARAARHGQGSPRSTSCPTPRARL